MTSGQILLALGALMLLSMMALSLNSMMLDGNKTMMESEFYVAATSIAQSYIEHAAVLKFDVAVGTQSPSTFPGSFTSPYSLGPSAGECYPNYNDADDFDGYSTTVTTPRGDYNVSITVKYCDAQGNDSGVRTYFKKMQVTVNNPFMPTPVVMTRILAYTM